MALAPINPTQLTPPRVALIDERSGAISREWYRFFLSLLTATQTNQEETELAPDATSLLATYDAMLASVEQASAVTSDGMVAGLESSLNNLQNAFGVTPPDLGGTVTSVAASGGTTGLTFTGSPITSSGTLTLGGTLIVANGGTGATTLTSGYLLKGNGTSAVSASVVYDTGTNVGIGTASPGAKLDVQSANITDGTNGGNVNIFTTSAQAANVGGKLDLGGLYDGSNTLSFASLAGRKENSTSGNWAGYMQFSTREFGGAFAERMRITSVGNVGIGATPNASALLDVQSTTKGFRLPNMTTTQKNAISSPVAGLMVFDTTLSKACVYSGAAWETITSL
jgi:hypothetical protein